MAALPRHLTPDRFIRIAMTELRKNPTLGICDPYSLLGAIIQSAQLGLEIGSGLGHAYLVPFKNRKRGIMEAQFIPGYKGLIDLARRSGHVETIAARIVRAKDEYYAEWGDDERIVHRPFRGTVEQAGTITDAYAIARFKGGGIQREAMTREQIEWVRERGNDNPVWETDFDEMARKTVVRRLCKYLPLSPEMADALSFDNDAYKGESQENWRVIDPSYEPHQEHDPAKLAAIMNDTTSTPPAAPGAQQRQATNDAADRTNAVTEYDIAAAAVRERGGDPLKLVAAVGPNMSVDDICAAADRMLAWVDNFDNRNRPSR